MESTNHLPSINPYNQDVISKTTLFTDSQIENTLSLANDSFTHWKTVSLEERSKLFLNLSNILKNQCESLAEIMTLEMGKLLSESKSEILKCALNCEYYAENSKLFLQDQVSKTKTHENIISFRPLGTILAIMPWNFPFWQVLRFATPTLMAGNTCILKHASNVSLCALAIERLFLEAGFSKGVFNTIIAKSDKIPKIISDSRIKAVTLTGSTPAGKSVARHAGENLKKCVLELGGSDPYIILESADISSAIQICAQSRLINAGQSCIAAKRFIIMESLYDEFKSGLIKYFNELQMGNPLSEQTSLAPLARIDLRDELHKQVQESLKKGANLVLGGNIPGSSGAFYEPTLLENISNENPAFFEEFFGPVALLFKVKSHEEALHIANGTSFGLGASVFTKDKLLGIKIAKEDIESGSCFINDFVRSDPRLPFGGIKESGYGRELSQFGIHEFVNIKTISYKM